MAQSSLEQLTEAQRECLRLVLSHHNSKEIAAILGVSPSAVDKRIERAVQMLGVPSRFAAARMLAEHEGGGFTSERLPCDAIDVPDAPVPIPSRGQGEPWWLARRLLGLPGAAGGGGRARNELTKLERIGVIVGLVFIIALSSMALLNIGQTISSFLAKGVHSSRQ